MSKRINLGNNRYTLLDDGDAIKFNKTKWYYCNGYARRTDNKTKKHYKLHREILNLKDNDLFHVDHINGNTLDNRKCNLRLCSHKENAKNQTKIKINKTSKLKGVCSHGKKWRSQINVNGEKVYLGVFSTEEQANRAYKNASNKYHGEYGYHESKILNVVDFNNYEILPRPKTYKECFTYSVSCSNGEVYFTIRDAAKALQVAENTIIKGCTKPQRVRGLQVSYIHKIEYTAILD